MTDLSIHHSLLQYISTLVYVQYKQTIIILIIILPCVHLMKNSEEHKLIIFLFYFSEFYSF